MTKLTIVAAVALSLFAAACSSGLKPSVRKDIESRMKSKHDRFQSCYSEALSRDKDLQGKMKLTFTVDKSGKFNDVKVAENSVKNSELEQCVVAQTSSLKLSKADKKPVAVSYQLVFERSVVTVNEQ